MRRADPRGATLYVSLEPCCHHGQTPPCTDAIVEAGIAPRRRRLRRPDREGLRPRPRDPARRGDRGRGRRRRAGGRARGCSTRPSASTRAPAARTSCFKSAMTLDGKVATRTGDSKWISGEESRLLSHHWRAERDAVVVGIGTALADDPQLTARIDGVARQPRRVVFDSEGAAAARLPARARRARAAADRRRRPRRLAARRPTRWRRAGAEVIVATGENEPARVRSALDQLGAAGVTLDPARGRPAARRRVPRRRRGRRDPAVRRAGRGRRLERARPARGRGRRADRRGDRARWRSTSSGSPTTC